MQTAHLVVQSPIEATPRVQQIRGMFDLAEEARSRVEWDIYLPLEDRPWNIGLITGPSGCGKTTIAKHLWPESFELNTDWPTSQSILDAFPAKISIKDIAELLCSVGFSSPPAWLRPFHVLSTGQQFRVTLARLLAESPDLAVMDEYTSVVDRTVAQIGSAALAKTVRRRDQKFVAVTCHEDVLDWLQPDWVYYPATNTFQWRLLQRRPQITLHIRRAPRALWKLFATHHYLNHGLASGAVCFAAYLEKDERPVAFSAWIHRMTKNGGKREHRTVTLPDFQGVGIGHALSNCCAAMWKGLDYRATSTTSHPAMIAARCRHTHWRMIRAPNLAAGPESGRLRHATSRLTAGFEYVGPAMNRDEAWKLLQSQA